MAIAIEYPKIDTGLFLFGKPNVVEVEPVEYLNWDNWLTKYFPFRYSAKFASHHEKFWQHIETIEPNQKPSAYFLILARGGGKDSNMEGAAVRLGTFGKRRFCLYVRATQDLANKTVQSIGAMLESSEFSQDYPQVSERQLTKYGHSRGWKMDLLRCANGFSIMGLGLDVSVRGLRLDELRPDLIVFSDIDDRKDSPDTILKKEDIIKNDILPAGSNDVAIVGIQNLIHKDSIFKKLADGKVDFLHDRIIEGPIPAIDGLAVEQGEDSKYHITNGTPTWPDGQSLDICEKQINEWGLTTFRIESQHEVHLVEGGMYANIKFQHCSFDEVPELVTIICAVDPAVTDNDNSDSHAIQIDGYDIDDRIYRLYSYEERSSPSEAIRLAIVKAIEYGADTIVFETDQGGDLWEESYERIWEELCEDEDYPQITWDTIQPDFIAARAGSIGSKKHRGQMQLNQYERGKFVHVRGTSHILEKALGRFPKRKPFDLHDAAFWSQYYLIEDAPAST
jgi:hypothetical protein